MRVTDWVLCSSLSDTRQVRQGGLLGLARKVGRFFSWVGFSGWGLTVGGLLCVWAARSA